MNLHPHSCVVEQAGSRAKHVRGGVQWQKADSRGQRAEGGGRWLSNWIWSVEGWNGFERGRGVAEIALRSKTNIRSSNVNTYNMPKIFNPNPNWIIIWHHWPNCTKAYCKMVYEKLNSQNMKTLGFVIEPIFQGPQEDIILFLGGGSFILRGGGDSYIRGGIFHYNTDHRQ